MSLMTGRKSLSQAFDEMQAPASMEQDSEALLASKEQGPLQGVVICLTGLTSDRKERFHTLVEKLGGRYTRDFNLDQNTHLVADLSQGAKYQLAVSTSKIQIVAPAWLEECQRQWKRVEERLFPVSNSKPRSNTFLPASIQPSYRQIFDILLKESNVKRSLFEYHQFYFVGFEDAEDIKKTLGRIIRRGGGTIHWDFSEDITILVLHDTCHDALWKAASILSAQHQNMPPMVSPRWIVDSFRRQTLVSTSKYPPLRQRSNLSRKGVASKTSKPRAKARHDAASSLVFQGTLVAMARVAPSKSAVDFDTKEQESIVRAHGGQILSSILVEAMELDAKSESNRKTCYVVCWGGAPQLDYHPLLSQLKRKNICDLVNVTPIWLASCIALQNVVVPDRMPSLFVPQSWPFQNLKEAELQVSLTGFIGTERMALVEVMKACGIQFRNEMTSSTTHLVCKERASGLKLEKALEWKICMVSIDWMYYVLRHGYSDTADVDDQFSVHG